MTKTYMLSALTAGILVFSLAGCLNPITITPPGGSSLAGTPAGVQEIPDGDQPFTLMLEVTGKDGASTGGTDRSIAGLRYADIKLSGTGARNYMQLIVTDGSGDIVSFSESRQENYVDTMGSLTTIPLDIANTYNFLFLMGHWEKEYTTNPTNEAYKPYSATNSPLTLMAAGYLGNQEIVAGTQTLQVMLYPITVDVKLINTAASSDILQPELHNVNNDWAGVPLKMEIPGSKTQWQIICEIMKDNGPNGLEILLQSEGEELDGVLTTAANAKIVVNSITPAGSSTLTPTGYTGSTFSFNWNNPVTASTLPDLVAETGSFNFNLDVYPFGKSAEAAWPQTLFAIEDNIKVPPKWIIRNGINNELPDAKTSYRPRVSPETPWGPNKNGNGAIAYQRTPEKAEEIELHLADGEWGYEDLVSDPHTVDIKFTPSGTSVAQAKLYYTIIDVELDGNNDFVVPPQEPEYGAYVLYTGGVPLTAETETEVTLNEDAVPHGDGDYLVWLLLFKDVYVSNALPVFYYQSDVITDWQ
jgi:hypothetical protein